MNVHLNICLHPTFYMIVHRHFILLPSYTTLLIVLMGCKSIYSVLPHQMYSKLTCSTNIFKQSPCILFNPKQFFYYESSLFYFRCTAQNSDLDCICHRTRQQHLWLWNPYFTSCRPNHTMCLVPGSFLVPSPSLPLLRIKWVLSVWTTQPQNMIQETKCEVQVEALTAVCVECRCLSSHYSQQEISCWVK